nr:hypothetical protein [Tanacetum cinerariifolium]
MTKPCSSFSANCLIAEGGTGDDEGSSPFTRSVNNETSVIDVDHLNSAPPSKVVANIRDSNGPSLDKDVADEFEKLQKVPPQASKVAGNAFDPLDVDSDPDIHEFPSIKELKDSVDYHWVVAHMTPPSWKQHLKDISLEKLYDIHDRAYMKQAILENMLNNRTHKLISTLMKATSSCDTIQEREREKDKAYADIEKICNDALQDLDKNPLVMNMHAEIETLQEKVDSFMESIAGLFLKRKSGCTAFKEVAALKEPFNLEKMPGYHSSSKKEFDQVSDDLATAFYPFIAKTTANPCTAFKEVAALKEPFNLEKMPGYHSSSKKEFDQVNDDLATAFYPFIAKTTANLYASVEANVSPYKAFSITF